VASAREAEQRATRNKQASLRHYQQELDLRARGLSDSEQAQRSALAEIGRALLGASSAVEVPQPWRERVQRATEQAEALAARSHLHAHAIDAYDRTRVRQGVRLFCTAAALMILLIVLKIAL
jgi:hypothetical protein